MSIKSLLMPAISRRMLSRRLVLERRASAERKRRANGEPHVVHYFHQADDPYSALVAQVLPALAARYDIRIEAHLVPAPADSVAPERERLTRYSRVDAQLLARHWGLSFADAGSQPAPQAVAHARAALVAAIDVRRFFEESFGICDALWRGVSPPGGPASSDARTQAHMKESAALRKKLGHYLGATLYYAGEWYWGIDRLHHLESRLAELGLCRSGSMAILYPLVPDLPVGSPSAEGPVIDFFFSLRSPYSAIVTPRILDLAKSAGSKVRLRYLLPMVMRGLPVPREKRAYIAVDAAREAHARSIDFGCVNDPVGKPAERGLALMAMADRLGRGEAYLRSFMKGVWAQGLDAGSDKGLRTIAERAGLAWTEAREALDDESWRDTAEANRRELFGAGLWGVPSFRVGEVAVWGQDRLWAVRDALSRVN